MSLERRGGKRDGGAGGRRGGVGEGRESMRMHLRLVFKTKSQDLSRIPNAQGR